MIVTKIENLRLYPNEYRYKYTISLQGSNREVLFYWNERNKMWYMDLREEDGTSIKPDIGLVPNYPICTDYAFQKFGLTGYFLLVPLGDTPPELPSTNYQSVPRYYTLSYVYTEEQDE